MMRKQPNGLSKTIPTIKAMRMQGIIDRPKARDIPQMKSYLDIWSCPYKTGPLLTC
jgi:hypothetical protein